MDKDQELYYEEQRAELIKLNSAVEKLYSLTEKQLQAYEPPKDLVQVSGEVQVNTEKEVAVSNLEAIRDYLADFAGEITTAIEKSVREPVKELSVKNIADAKAEAVKISNFKDLAIEFERIGEAIEHIPAPVVNVEKQEIRFPKSPTEAIPVRLSDGKSFYNAIATAMSSVVASFMTKDGKATPVFLKLDGSVPVYVENKSASDVFNQQIIGTRNNQLEIDFSGTDPDTVSLLTITKTNGGDATNGGGQATFTSGTNASGEINAVTTRTVVYHPHSENYAAFTAIFTQGIGNSFQRIGLYDDNNGFFIGFEGGAFGVTKRSAGVDSFTLQALFSEDKLVGEAGSKYTRNGVPEHLDHTKDNLYRIRYGWLGAAPIYYEVLSPDGEWVIFHIIKHPNTLATPTIEEPNLPLRLHIKKTNDGAVNLSVKTACWAAGTSSDLAKITSTLYDDTLAKTVRSVIVGQTTGQGGGYVNVKVNPSGALAVEATLSQPATIYSGKTTVTTSGTRVALASTTAVKTVTVKAASANTGIIYVGNSSVSSANGFELNAKEEVTLTIDNLSKVYIDSSTNSQSVVYLAEA